MHPEETDLIMAHQEHPPAVSVRSQSQPSLKEVFPENYPDVQDEHSGDSRSTLEYIEDQSQSFEDPDSEHEQLILEKSRPYITPTLRTPQSLYQERKQVQSKKQLSGPVHHQQVKSKLTTRVNKRKRNKNRLPSNLTRGLFEQFCGLKVTREALELVELCCDQFFKNLSSDLMTFADHAGRKTVQVTDIELLFHRQRLVTDQQSLYALVEKYLPLEYREKIVPMATVKNNVKP
ncbi:centromere protein T-like [Limulus polyphemus]|uniref:Centromere protein T-like n=1 Tax=Limulus polyphemus TaxID=6850 RepID=A0ABM1S6F3_LIMPO|nr:centromere protein T-like [Limulus polyphemus]XP_022239215.1 centromere protein T-like [Limulus polyphemus]